MRIAAGTLFFTIAVFLHSIELSSSHSFWELFPETLGDLLPPIRTLEYKDTEQSWNLRKLVDNRITEFNSNATLIARAHVIIGWRDKDNIEPLSDLSGKIDHVFDTNQKLFINLNRNDQKILGVNRRFSKICCFDQAAALRRPTPQENLSNSGLALKHRTALLVSSRENHATVQETHNQAVREIQRANYEELSSSHMLSELFPETLGHLLPPISTFKYKDTEKSWNLRKFLNDRVTGFYSDSILIARAHVIIGWPYKDSIRPLSDISGRTDHVFDSKKKQFVKINEIGLRILGVGGRWSAIRPADETAALFRPSPQAHHITNYELEERHITTYQVSSRENHQISQEALNQKSRRRAGPQANHEETHPASRRRSNPQEDPDSNWLSLRLPGLN